jgi:hypothetical protein
VILPTRRARFSGFFLIFAISVLAADDDAGLRAAEQLVAGEGDEVGAGGQRASCGVGSWAGQRARSVSVPLPRSTMNGTAVGVRDGGDLGFVDHLGEALHRVVRGVHLHQQRRLRADGLGVVLGVGAVGGADLDQLGAGAAHDVGHAEGAADLDQFAARDDGLLALDQRVRGPAARRRRCC